jgi:hypothetical protein
MENKLDPEFKAKWLAELRSGKYSQTQGRLCDEDGYCCLGVAGKAAGLWDTQLERMGGYLYRAKLRKLKVSLPSLITGHANMRGGKGYNSIVAELAEMNDQGKSFSEIADYIEANL